jgi:predicted kinase
MTLIDDRIGLFDCLEFNLELRWTDVISDTAFLIMDLSDRGYSAFARLFLNTYLAHTGDYEGLTVLNYYCVYRAMVRAKVTLLRLDQQQQSDITMANELSRTFKIYMKLAHMYSRDKTPLLIIAHGPSGSGKSYLCSKLVERMGAIQIRTDLERKRLFGVATLGSSQSALNQDMYTSEATSLTYRRCVLLAKTVLASGRPAIIDGTFLHRDQRVLACELARELHIPFIILSFDASEEVLRKRVIDRLKLCCDPSEANLQVLESQLKSREPLAEEEKKDEVRVDTSTEPNIDEVCRRVIEKAYPLGIQNRKDMHGFSLEKWET